MDTAMTQAGIVARRMPYQTNNDLRKAINNGSVKYTDLHLSHVAQMTRYGFMENRRCVDVAIVEACKIIDLGNGQVGLIPTTSILKSSLRILFLHNPVWTDRIMVRVSVIDGVYGKARRPRQQNLFTDKL